ncbi:MAG TPA: hypothetical protein VHN37_15970 [Actinomycetota bacterium]|nr:hypothetical protein [Actinomycetota bacterium]
MRKAIVSSLVAGLVGGALLVAPAQAKKGPIAVNFFLRGPDCTAEVLGLSVKDEPGDGTCGGLENGAVNGVSQAAGQPVVSQVWAAYDGLPLTLDAAKPVTGNLYAVSWVGPSAGPATVDVLIEATLGGKTVEVGAATVDYMVTPGLGASEIAFEIDVPDSLNKKKITGLRMTTTSRGYAPLQGYYEMEDPASFITIPAIGKV